MPRTDNFQKFVKQKKGSALKEELRQQKKKAKKDRAEAIEKHYERKRAEKLLRQEQAASAKSVNKTGEPNKNARPLVKGDKVERVSAKDKQGVGANASTTMADKTIMPLNKYVAHSGLCSRRDAAQWVKDGKISVNGTVVTDPGHKVSQADDVKMGNKRLTPSRNFVYLLLNKPKDYITTSEDPQGRKTVLDLVRSATDERVYPVGRLDRNTSGVLLLTNDGELAQKLSHPRHEVKKVYEVKLDRPVTKADLDKIASGLTLEDGFIAPDSIAYADAHDKSIIGIEIHSGKNRIVRRIFEHLKYDVKGLDRVVYAGLTKKDVPRGKWRFLKEKEVRILKFLNKSTVKTNSW